MKSNESLEVWNLEEDWNHSFADLQSAYLLRWRYFYIVCLCCTLSMGIPGNIMVIYSIASFKYLQQLPHILVVNLAIFDLGVMTMNIMSLLGCFFGGDFFTFLICEISGTICMISCFGSLWSIMAISVNRYICICHNALYKTIFNTKTTVLLALSVWVATVIMDIPNWPFVGLSKHGLVYFSLHCAFLYSNNWWYDFFFYTGFAFLFPVCITAFCYRSIWKSANKMKNNFSEQRRKQQRQMTKSLMIIFCIFIITWSPLSIIIGTGGLFGDKVKIPFEVNLIAEIFAHGNSSINFLVYGFTHTKFRQAYLTILSKFVPCIKKPSSE